MRKNQNQENYRINGEIFAEEVRLIDEKGENVGVVTTVKARELAEKAGLDLIEITAKATPPVAKIADYGKFQYAEKKKQKETKSRGSAPELKIIQIKIGTGDHDLELKAQKINEWLKDGSRIKIELFLPGRSKYLDQKFLIARFDRILRFVSVSYKVIQAPIKSPKGLTMAIDKGDK